MLVMRKDKISKNAILTQKKFIIQLAIQFKIIYDFTKKKRCDLR